MLMAVFQAVCISSIEDCTGFRFANPDVIKIFAMETPSFLRSHFPYLDAVDHLIVYKPVSALVRFFKGQCISKFKNNSLAAEVHY